MSTWLVFLAGNLFAGTDPFGGLILDAASELNEADGCADLSGKQTSSLEA